ncbi:DMT family transporter [Variovorax sp. KK3]|uniref:DMT family transporter n=1 Tax=Variovorax sp. KK3 TaxID=1855728 RepID=UPI00097C3EBD|nr:DMT family transporter [Variovorax sp. KK3]
MNGEVAAASGAAADGPLRLRALLLVTMAMWGINITVVKLLLGQIDVLPLATLRMLLATAVMLPFCWARLPTLARLGRAQWLRLAACAAVLVYAHQLLAISGMARTSTTHTALIAALTPIVGMLVATAGSMERTRPLGLLGVLLGFAGVAVAILAKPGAMLSGLAYGDLLMFLSVFAFAGGSAWASRVAPGLDTLVLSAAVHGIGAVYLLMHTLVFAAPSFGAVAQWTGSSWAMLLFSGACANGVGLLVYMRSIERLGVGRATSALYWVPIFGIGFGALFGAQIQAMHLVGLAGVVAGTWLTARWAPRRIATSPPSA